MGRLPREGNLPFLLDQKGFEIVGGPPEDMAGMMKRDIERWHPVVKASGAKAE